MIGGNDKLRHHRRNRLRRLWSRRGYEREEEALRERISFWRKFWGMIADWSLKFGKCCTL